MVADPSTAAGTPILPGIAPIAGRYDAYILDLWGVLHNGERPFPGVLDALARLRDMGRRICLLSNAPRRPAAVIKRLGEIGIPRDLYDVVMTSGEATHEALSDPPDAFHAALGQRCLHLGPPRDGSVLEGLPFVEVDEPAAAEWVLNTGTERYEDTLDQYRDLLAACAAHRLPMVCANPDLVVVVGTMRSICAGTLADHYESLGGAVAYHGKPHKAIYDRCFELLGHPDPSRVLAVGDSLRTDIAGAAAAGIDSLLVIGGIHAEEWAKVPDGPADPAKLAEALRAAGHAPVAAVETLRW